MPALIIGCPFKIVLFHEIFFIYACWWSFDCFHSFRPVLSSFKTECRKHEAMWDTKIDRKASFTLKVIGKHNQDTFSRAKLKTIIITRYIRKPEAISRWRIRLKIFRCSTYHEMKSRVWKGGKRYPDRILRKSIRHRWIKYTLEASENFTRNSYVEKQIQRKKMKIHGSGTFKQ